MNNWEVFIIAYGLIISPIMGVRFLKWRVNGGVKTFKDMLIYLLVGFGNAASTFFALIFLPEGSWLTYPAMLILLLYVSAYAYTQVNVNMR